MPTLFTRMIAFAAGALLMMPRGGHAQSEGVTVIDFSNASRGGVIHSLTATGTLRRGVTSTVIIVKNLIDLVPDGQIGVTGAATLASGITHGRTSGGEGFISMKVSASSAPAVGSGVAINVGLLDHFHFLTVHRGLVTGVAFNPNPTTVLGGTAFQVTVSGTDFGAPGLTSICHSVANVAHTATTVTATLTRTATCTNLGPFSFSVSSNASGEPGIYAKSDGTFSFSFGPYLTPAQTGVECVNVPTLGAPVIQSPVNNSSISFFTASGSPQTIKIVWSAKDANAVAVPNDEWLVTLPTTTLSRGSTIDVVGTSITPKFPVPGTYTVSLKAKNCGTAAPSASVTFTLKFQ